jgi:hypothetical protein
MLPKLVALPVMDELLEDAPKRARPGKPALAKN